MRLTAGPTDANRQNPTESDRWTNRRQPTESDRIRPLDQPTPTDRIRRNLTAGPTDANRQGPAKQLSLGLGDIGLYGLYNNGFLEYVAGEPCRWPVSYGRYVYRQ